jgi:8-oxo-dGTP pyrophosphatase MutT (NUDIX family)
MPENRAKTFGTDEGGSIQAIMDELATPLRRMLKARKQVAALPVMYDTTGTLRVMLVTSRETKRLIIPKGWPKKGYKDCRTAAIEAQEEAGLIGKIQPNPIGSYTYWKRFLDRFVLCKVKVFPLEVTSQLIDWPEKGQREGVWLLVDDAVEAVGEPGLVTILRDLPNLISRKSEQRNSDLPAVPVGARYAIHIVRAGRMGGPPQLLMTYKDRGELEVVQKHAHDLLCIFPQIEPADFVVVRLVQDGREVYRWVLPGPAPHQSVRAEVLGYKNGNHAEHLV